MKYPERIKNKKILSLFSYYDYSGALAYVTAIDEDREYHIVHKDKRRHWKFTAPEANYPYRLPHLLATLKDSFVLIVQSEGEAEELAALGFNVTTCRAFIDDASPWYQWRSLFEGMRVVILPHANAHGEIACGKVYRIFRETTAGVIQVHLPMLDINADVITWLQKNGFGIVELETLLEAEWAKNGPDPKWQAVDEEAAAAVSDANEIDPAAPEPEERYHSDWKPFPVDVLPIEAAEYVQEGARLLNCDPAYLALGALVTLGGAVGNSRVCRLNGEWIEPSVFWGCLIAENSTLKSPASDKATEPIDELEDGFADSYTQEADAYDQAFETWRFNGRFRKPGDLDTNAEPPPKKPAARRIKVDDITVEKLAEILFDNDKGLILIRDELAGWFGSFTRYKSGIGGTDMPFWLEVFRARSRTVDRKGGNRPSIRIKRAAVSVYGTIQPETVSDIFKQEGFFTSGFVARILFAMPPKPRKVFVEGGINAAARFAYKEMFRNLYFIDGELTQKKNRPVVYVDFTAGGMDAWREFHKEWAVRQYVSFGEVGSALSKLEGYCARFAMLFALCDFVTKRSACEEVTADHIARAFELVTWFAREAERVYKLIRAEKHELRRDKILELVRRHDNKITPKELFNSNRSFYGDTATARARLDELVSQGALKVKLINGNAAGGRPSTVYIP